MSLKTYTITATGQTSNGNALAQPFTVEVHQITIAEDGGITDVFNVNVCAINGSGNACVWDQLEAEGYSNGLKSYEGAPGMTSSNNANLASTLEVDLEAVAPSKWS